MSCKVQNKSCHSQGLRGVNWFKKMLGESKGKRLKNYYVVLRKKDHHQFRHDCVIILVWGSWERFSFLFPLLGVLIGFDPQWVLKLFVIFLSFLFTNLKLREREKGNFRSSMCIVDWSFYCNWFLCFPSCSHSCVKFRTYTDVIFLPTCIS